MEKTNKRKTKEEFEEKSLLAMLLSETVHFKIIFKTVIKLMAVQRKYVLISILLFLAPLKLNSAGYSR